MKGLKMAECKKIVSVPALSAAENRWCERQGLGRSTRMIKVLCGTEAPYSSAVIYCDDCLPTE